MKCDSLRSLAARIRSGNVTSTETVKSSLQRTQLFSNHNLFTEIDEENSIRRSAEIDNAISDGKDVGVLGGVPIVVKDNIDTAGLLTTAGSSAFEGWRPPKDAPIVAALKVQGAIVLGKTNMHELAFGVTSNNPVYGPVRNPYDKNMISGGSSGGTAAAISAGIVGGGFGTDTGGSCRMPASLCGCVGFRPSDGRYSGEGLIPLSWTRDAPGPLGGSVDDVVLIDSICARVPANTSTLCSLDNLRIAVPRAHFCELLDKDVRGTFEETLARLRAVGAVIVEADFEGLPSLVEKTRDIVLRFEAVKALSNYLAVNGISRSPRQVVDTITGKFEREFIESSLGSARVDAVDYLQALLVHRPALQNAYKRYFEENAVSAFVVPAAIRPASRIGEDTVVDVDGHQLSTFQAFTHNTAPSSVAGVPCLTLPMGLSTRGLPLGLEIVGPAAQDGDVFAIGRLIEKEIGPLAAPMRS